MSILLSMQNRRKEQGEKRVRAHRMGILAEMLVMGFYYLRGYRLYARRFRCHRGEVDLIMRRGRLTAFVEVKYRGGKARASAIDMETEEIAIPSARQQQRIRDAAGYWLARHCRRDVMETARIDLVILRGLWCWRIIGNAF